jgi:hypothetical protein
MCIEKQKVGFLQFISTKVLAVSSEFVLLQIVDNSVK